MSFANYWDLLGGHIGSNHQPTISSLPKQCKIHFNEGIDRVNPPTFHSYFSEVPGSADLGTVADIKKNFDDFKKDKMNEMDFVIKFDNDNDKKYILTLTFRKNKKLWSYKVSDPTSFNDPYICNFLEKETGVGDK